MTEIMIQGPFSITQLNELKQLFDDWYNTDFSMITDDEETEITLFHEA